jgi:predicted FMN-binding regulatory protein PaiB
MREIVVFRVLDLKFDAKFKLSQRQSASDRAEVISQLQRSGNQVLDNLAKKMQFGRCFET